MTSTEIREKIKEQHEAAKPTLTQAAEYSRNVYALSGEYTKALLQESLGVIVKEGVFLDILDLRETPATTEKRIAAVKASGATVESAFHDLKEGKIYLQFSK